MRDGHRTLHPRGELVLAAALTILACPGALHAGNPADICTAFPAGLQILNGPKESRLQTPLVNLPARSAERENYKVGDTDLTEFTRSPIAPAQHCAADQPGTARGRLHLYVVLTASGKHALMYAENVCFANNIIHDIPAPDDGSGIRTGVHVHAGCAKVTGIGDLSFEGRYRSSGESGTSYETTDGRMLTFARGPYMAYVTFSLGHKAAAYAAAQQTDKELARWKPSEPLDTPQLSTPAAVTAAHSSQGAMMPPRTQTQGAAKAGNRTGLGSAAPCFPNDQGAATLDAQGHYSFARSQSAAALEANLLEKVRTVYGCKAMTSGGRSTFFADVSVLIAKRFRDARCFDGNKDVISTDWNAHKNLWNGTNQWLDDLVWKVSAALHCMNQEDQAAFFSEVSTTIASAPDRP